MIRISDSLTIPENELIFSASRSSGPGGQHVNKVETRVTISFDVANSSTLSEQQKELIEKRLSRHINREGVLRVTSGEHRSQFANRKAALERLTRLFEGALRFRRRRRRTSVPYAEQQRRLRAKVKRSRIKKLRSSPVELDE